MRTRRLDGKKLRSVTAVNRSNLWHGAHRWLENSKRERGRFAGLDVVERILPQTTPQESSASLGIHVRDEENDGRTRPLLEAIASSADHGYLIGEGGIGKTTALIHIMNAAYDGKASPPDGQIPIFVELSYAPDTEGELYRGGKSSFIRRSVFRQIMDERAYRQLLHTDVSDMEMVCRLPKAVAVDPINAEFAKRTPQPEYLLLLDGLNEVSTVHLEKYGQSVLEMIIAEIHLLMTEYPNVRLLLTSRSDELTIQDQKLTRYYLSGVEPTDVRRYLEEQGMSAKQVARAMQESTLVEILRIPLFLTMYAALTDKEGVCTRGEILRLFFSERRMHMQLYTSSGRFAQIEHNVWLTSDTQLRRFTKQMQNFILDFILPEIAWYMEREGKFYLSVRMLRRLIRPVLYEKTDHSATGEFGQAVFTQYSQEKARYNTERTAEALRDCLGGVERTVLDGVIDCSAMSLGILQGSGDSYGFIHQHIRDYFAAVRNINALRLAVYMHKEEEQELALECMNSVFAQRPVGMTVRRFMGEYLGEHHNQPRQTTRGMVYGVPKDPQDRNLIDRALNIYRGVFDGKIGYGLHSLVKILAEVRKTLAGIDFTALDLTRCQLNRTRLGADGLPARLGGAKLGAENLFLPGHRRAISHLAYSPDENRLLSASDDGSVKLWDVLTGELLHSIECGGSVLLAEYIDGGRKILTVEIHEDDRDRTHRICVCLWDSRTFSRMAEITIQGSGCRSSATLSPDGKHLFICGNDKYSMLCLDPLKEIWAREVADYPISMIVHAAFLGAENVQIRFEGLENDTVEVLPVSGGPGDLYDAEESPYGYTCINPLRTEAAVLVCGPDDRCLRIVDLASGKVIREIANRGRYNGRGSSLGYSGNGKWLYAYINDRVELYRTDGYTLAHAFENKWAPYLFNAAEDRLILTCIKNNIYTYELANFTCVQRLAGISGRRCSAAISSESKWILTTAGDGIPCVWNKEDLKLEKTGQPDVYVYEYLTGGELAKLSTDSSTDLLSVPDPQIRGRYPKWAQVSPDGKYYSVESDSGISIYRTSDDSQVCTAENADYVIFSGDRALVWRRRQSQVSIFDLNSGAQLCDPICCKPAALHGDHLVFFRKDKGLYYRALNSKEAPDIDLDWSETCDGLQYSPDGKYLIQFGRGYIAARDTQRYQILHLRQFSRYAEFFCGNKTVAVEDDDPDALGRTLITICRIDTLEPVSFVHIDGSPTEHTSRYILAYEDQGLLIYRSEDTLHYYRITDAGVEFVGPITLVPGLDVKGVDLRNLHSNSVFSDRQKQILGQYGAII